MLRKRRLEYENAFYHVMNRGRESDKLFFLMRVMLDIW